MTVYKSGLKLCNLCGGLTYKVVRECCRLNIPLKLNAIVVVVNLTSHAIVFLKLSLCLKNALALTNRLRDNNSVLNNNLRLCCVVESCYDNTVNSYNCCEINVHADSSLEVVTSRTVISAVNAKAKNDLALGSEGHSLIIVASLYNCCDEVGDLNGATCSEESLISGNNVTVSLSLSFHSLNLCDGLAYAPSLECLSLLEPLLNDTVTVTVLVLAPCCHVVIKAKLLLGKKVREYDSVTDGVLVLNCIDLACNDYAVLIKNNSCDSCIDLCIGKATKYKTHTKGILVGYRSNVVRIGLAALALTLYESMGMRSNVVGIGLATLALTFYKTVSMRSNVVRIAFATFTYTVYIVMSVTILATKYKYEYKYKNKGCSYCATDDSKSLLAEIEGKLGSFVLFLNGSLNFFRLLIVEILHFFAHFFFSFKNFIF